MRQYLPKLLVILSREYVTILYSLSFRYTIRFFFAIQRPALLQHTVKHCLLTRVHTLSPTSQRFNYLRSGQVLLNKFRLFSAEATTPIINHINYVY